MHVNLLIVVASALIGLFVGMTGTGGGALMTPALIFVFGVLPGPAIASDLLASVVMRPVGAAVHGRAGTIDWRLVRWLSLGSVPLALAGAWLAGVIGGRSGSPRLIETVLGATLLAGAGAMAVRACLHRPSQSPSPGPSPVRRPRRGRPGRDLVSARVTPRPVATVAIGSLGGVLVGMTSVGAGSLMTVLLLAIYPRIEARQLVGTDLAQAVPLTLSAAVGSLLFGSVEIGLTASLILGSVPGVLLGARLSTRVPDRVLRPLIMAVLAISGLKYIGLSTTILALATATAALGWAGASVRRRASSGTRTPQRAVG